MVMFRSEQTKEKKTNRHLRNEKKRGALILREINMHKPSQRTLRTMGTKNYISQICRDEIKILKTRFCILNQIENYFLNTIHNITKIFKEKLSKLSPIYACLNYKNAKINFITYK